MMTDPREEGWLPFLRAKVGEIVTEPAPHNPPGPYLEIKSDPEPSDIVGKLAGAFDRGSRTRMLFERGRGGWLRKQ